jgi:hypothetical protein
MPIILYHLLRTQWWTKDGLHLINKSSAPATQFLVLFFCILVNYGQQNLQAMNLLEGSPMENGSRKVSWEESRIYISTIRPFPVTVRHLLEHTSGGWNNVDSDPAWLMPTKGTQELIERVLAEQPLVNWDYPNGDLDLGKENRLNLLCPSFDCATGQSVDLLEFWLSTAGPHHRTDQRSLL